MEKYGTDFLSDANKKSLDSISAQIEDVIKMLERLEKIVEKMK